MEGTESRSQQGTAGTGFSANTLLAEKQILKRKKLN